MAKITPRRRVTLDNPEEVYTLAQRLLAPVKPYAKWLVLAAVVIAVGLGAWGVNARLQAGRTPAPDDPLLELVRCRVGIAMGAAERFRNDAVDDALVEKVRGVADRRFVR